MRNHLLLLSSLLCVSACSTSQAGNSTKLASSSTDPQAPESYRDGLPIIPLDTAGFRGSSQGPLLALVFFHNDEPLNDQDLRLSYHGVLPCTSAGLTVGVVQNNAKIGDFKMAGTTIDRAGDIGECAAQVPLSSLQQGEISFYVYDQAGVFDSNFGQNYRFILDYQNIIR